MSPVKMSKIEFGIRAVLDYVKAFNRHDVPHMMQFLSENCVFENAEPAPDGAVYLGKEEITQFWLDFFRESPAAHIKIEDISGFGKQCLMKWSCEWVDESGTQQHIRGFDIFQVENDLICEILSYVKGVRNFQG